jgi:hypothetical protein
MAKRPSGGGGTVQDLPLILFFRNADRLRQIGTTGNVRFAAKGRRSRRLSPNQQLRNHLPAQPRPLTILKTAPRMLALTNRRQGDLMSGKAVLENVRRYRAIASLYRQTAAFRPLQKWSLLDQAEEWERLAVAELETYFDICDRPAHALQLSAMLVAA